MSTQDINGRPWAKLSELKEGDMIEVDGGFDCIIGGTKQTLTLQRGILGFECLSGHHDIAGQADDCEHCIGIYKVQP
jgi:hypothetical protein